MNILANLIKELEYEELLLIRKDLEAGTLKKVVKKQLEQKRRDQVVSCPVCEQKLTQGEGFYLEFGSNDFRKKATFDGVDCLKYFIENHLSKK
jgi:hypothetical protein